MQPILVLQMQRMGDLVLSFPLLLLLRRLHPGPILRVVAEERFFTPLLPVSPPAGYVTWPEAASGALAGTDYSLVINLSIREEAARLAGSLRAERVLGPAMGADGILRIHGPWQLYRASLVHNNRHNRFHWADLNALDAIPPDLLGGTRFAPPNIPAKGNPAGLDKAVGVFVGASEPGKRPTPEFYAGLVAELLARDLRPVLLGGPDDRPVAEAVLALCPHKPLDMTGRLSVAELAAIGKTLGLMITPDTGPMHLAAWTGLRTLNLSVGNVSPWETGPYQPGHLVVRSRASCARGCWACGRARHLCRDALTPRRIAALAALALAGQEDRLARVSMPGLRLYESARGPEGLYALRPLGPEPGATAGEQAGEFWRDFFLWRLSGAELPGGGERQRNAARAAWAELSHRHPALARGLGRSLSAVSRDLKRQAGPSLAGAAPFWRPLAGYLDVLVRNGDGSPGALRQALEHLEALAEVCG